MKDLLLCVYVVVKTLNLDIVTFLFGRLRQRIVLKCVPHVQHDYFSAFNQSDHRFLASSLPLPSSLLKLPDLPIVYGVTAEGEGGRGNPAPAPRSKTKKEKKKNVLLISCQFSFLPVPVVWSLFGPVLLEGVFPVLRIQLKSDGFILSLAQWHILTSNSQSSGPEKQDNYFCKAQKRDHRLPCSTVTALVRFNVLVSIRKLDTKG